MVLAAAAPAQEALRSSIAYDQAVVQNQNPAVNLQPDRPRLGPVQLALGAYAGADFQDNVTYSQTDRLSDVILHTGVTVGFDWPATPQSDLTLNTSLGYAHYLRYSQYDYWEVGPNSVLSWNVLLDDTTLTFFDQFSYSDQVSMNAALSGVANYPVFDNTAGVRVNWQPGQWTFQTGYSHDDYFSSESSLNYLDRSSEYFFGRAGWRFAENTQAGLEASGSLTRYWTPGQGDTTSVSFGPYAEWQVTHAIHATLRGGPTVYMFGATAAAAAETKLGSYYLAIQLSHQLTDYLSQRIDIERNVSLGYNPGGQFVEQLSANYSVSCALTQWIDAGAGFTYEHGTQTFQNLATVPPANETEVYDRYSAGPMLSWKATDKLTADLSYNYYLRQSNLPDRGYLLNSVSLRIHYAF